MVQLVKKPLRPLIYLAIASLLLGWSGAEFLLARWGASSLPINRTRLGYSARADVLFMGNSRVASGMRPEPIARVLSVDLGRPVQVYNLGVGSTPIGVHYLLLRRLREQNRLPTTLVYGFASNDLTQTDFLDDYNLAEAAAWQDVPLLLERSLHTMDSRIDFLVKELVHLYRYRFHIRSVLERTLQNNTSQEQARIDQGQQGFQDFRNIVRPEAVAALKQSELFRYQKTYSQPNEWRFEPEHTYLGDLVQLCKENGVRLVLVEMPITAMHRRVAAASPYSEHYRAALQAYLARHHIPYIDMHGFADDTLLPDTMHLSAQGADLLSERLAAPDLRRVLLPKTGSK